MDDQERASIDLPSPLPNEPIRPLTEPSASMPPLRWPVWTMPVGMLVRDLPLVLAIVVLVEVVVRAGAWAGVEYLREVSVEERAAYRIFATLLFVVVVILMRLLSWFFRPKKDGGRRALSHLFFLPFYLAGVLVWAVFRYAGLYTIGLSAIFLGMGLPVLPECPPIPGFRMGLLLLLVVTGVGAVVVGLRLGWQFRKSKSQDSGPALKSAGWLVAGIFLIAVCAQTLSGLSRLRALDALLASAAPVEKAERLVKALNDSFDPIRAYAAKDLADVAPYMQDAIPILTDALEDESAEVRLGAVRALCEIGHPDTLPLVLDAASRRRLLFGSIDMNYRLRWEVIRGIHKFRYAAQLEVLNGPNPVHRAMLLRGAASHSSEPLPTQVVLRASDSSFLEERRAAFQVLENGEHKESEVLTAMQEYLKDPETERAASACQVLASMGDYSAPAIPALIELATKPDMRLRRSAADALIRLGACARKPLEAARLQASPEGRAIFEDMLRKMEPAPRGKNRLPAEAPPQLAEAPPGFDLEVRLIYDGKPFDWCSIDKKPMVRLYSFDTHATLLGEPDGEGRLIVKNAQAGKSSISVRIDAVTEQPQEDCGPGDYVGDASVTIESGGVEPVVVAMHRILHLTSPVDNREVLKGGSFHAGSVRFAWDSLGEGVRYDVTIRGTMPVFWEQKSTTGTHLDLDIGPGTYCIGVTARREKNLIGSLSVVRSVEYVMAGTKRTRVLSQRWYEYRAMPLESGPVTVSGTLNYGGKPFDAKAQGLTPVLKVRDLLNNKVYEGRVELDGCTYRLPDIPSGVYEVKVAIDAAPGNPPGYPGDFFGTVSFSAREGRKAQTSINLIKVIRLLKPEDSARGVVFYPGAKMPPRVPNPVVLSWEPLGEGVTYYYYVTPSGKNGHTKEASITLDLPDTGTTYNFCLYALVNGLRVGELTFDGENFRTTYPFNTSD